MSIMIAVLASVLVPEPVTTADRSQVVAPSSTSCTRCSSIHECRCLSVASPLNLTPEEIIRRFGEEAAVRPPSWLTR